MFVQFTLLLFCAPESPGNRYLREPTRDTQSKQFQLTNSTIWCRLIHNVNSKTMSYIRTFVFRSLIRDQLLHLKIAAYLVCIQIYLITLLLCQQVASYMLILQFQVYIALYRRQVRMDTPSFSSLTHEKINSVPIPLLTKSKFIKQRCESCIYDAFGSVMQITGHC